MRVFKSITLAVFVLFSQVAQAYESDVHFGLTKWLGPPYNVSVLNAECALFALEHTDVFAQQAAVIRTEREALFKALQHMAGVTPYASEANMMVLRFNGDADAANRAFEVLKAHKVLVKNVSKMHPLLANCLRLTVGTPDENQQLLAALQAALS